MKTSWHDAGREPQETPDARYPLGIDLDVSAGAAVTCTERLPYPARRCGLYLVSCETCGQTALITTAGRIDDPRSIKIACKLVKPGH